MIAGAPDGDQAPRMSVLALRPVKPRALRSVDAPCPYELCGGDGWVWVGPDGAQVSVDQQGDPDWLGAGVDPSELEQTECHCYQQRVKTRRIERALRNVPKSLRHVGFDRGPINLMPHGDVDPVRTWTKNAAENIEAGRGLWLTGGTGNGKSTLAAAVVLESAHLGHTAGYWPFSLLLRTIRATSYSEGATMTDRQWVRELGELDLLVLDDLGAERPDSEHTRNILYDILEARSSHGSRPVIVTTNLTLDHLEQRLEQPIVSRLFDLCGEPITMTAPDHRRRAALHAVPDPPATQPGEGA